MQAHHLTLGKIVGDYRIVERLGSGGMGIVYRAQHIETREYVALKTIRTVSEMQLVSIRREILGLARIQHPGIVHIKGEGIHHGVPWYAMEFLSGVTLRQYFSTKNSARFGPPGSLNMLPDADMIHSDQVTGDTSDQNRSMIATRTSDIQPALSAAGTGLTEQAQVPRVPEGALVDLVKIIPLVQQICATLSFLHGAGLVHRDLKPDNIIITQDGIPVLVDFGIMLQVSGKESREILSVEHGMVGTVHYMAPEQIRGEFVDARADLYSLGCILYELLTGKPPFARRDIKASLEGHLYLTPHPVSRVRSDIPSRIDELVLNLLAKDPRDRVGYADVVSSVLTQVTGNPGPLLRGPKPRSYLYRPRFAGRDSQLEILIERGKILASGQGGLVLIGGESGVGKTRLIIEFGHQMALQSIQVLTGECSDTTGRPLEVLLKPLQRIADRCRERGQKEADRVFGKRGSLLSQYEPSIADLPGQNRYEKPADLPVSEAKTRLFMYLCETFHLFSQEEPVLLILDDLHWADELVTGFLEYLLKTEYLGTIPFLIVGTYRPEERGLKLQKIISSEGKTDLDLTRLQDQAVATIISDMLALYPAPPLFCEFLSRHCEGNPFFVAEYIRTS
ncbi:protein kinase [candidate division CSSED10-310 bacterium]|uniref:Protein kinase n=1 Tax=candidate division CSSED10-310 bacterium TaxID=2855610 RepID=A0ABV6YTX2_UNCC1